MRDVLVGVWFGMMTVMLIGVFIKIINSGYAWYLIAAFFIWMGVLIIQSEFRGWRRDRRYHI